MEKCKHFTEYLIHRKKIKLIYSQTLTHNRVISCKLSRVWFWFSLHLQKYTAAKKKFFFLFVLFLLFHLFIAVYIHLTNKICCLLHRINVFVCRSLCLFLFVHTNTHTRAHTRTLIFNIKLNTYKQHFNDNSHSHSTKCVNL